MINQSADLIAKNKTALVRKTDETIRVSISNADLSNFAVGSYTFYLTVRKYIPPTSQIDDDDSNVIIKKTVVVDLTVPTATLATDFSLTQIELDIEPKMYFYDVKYNDSSNITTSITDGSKNLEIVADITRRNV